MYAEGGAPRVLSVQASHCQGDVRYDSFSRNHQCTCVALTFLVNHSEGITFKMPDLDRVLKEGDAWYVGIKMQLIAEGRFNRNLLTMEEVPLSVSSFNRIHNVRKSGVMIGYLRATGNPGMEEWCIPLTERLQCLSTDVSHALLLGTKCRCKIFCHVGLHQIHLHFYSLEMLYILLLNKERDLSLTLYLLQVLNFYFSAFVVC